MKFKIYRTSAPFEENYSPCENAYLVEINDRYQKKGWCININSIYGIKKLIKEVGPIIINNDNSIEIYDNYRE